MKKLWLLFDHRTVWTSGPALLAIVVAPAMAGLVLKALRLAHGTSLDTWQLDVGQNMGWFGAIGGFFSAAAASAGWPGFFKGDPYPPFAPPSSPYGDPDGRPPRPPGFKNWSQADRMKWYGENPRPPATLGSDIMLGLSWLIENTTGVGTETTQANGCTKG
jgi:hypothetical protein